MKHDVSNLQKADNRRPDPSQSISVEWQQEWFRNMLLCSVLFFVLCIMGVFIYLGTFKGNFRDNPGTRHIEPNGPAYVMNDIIEFDLDQLM